MRTSFLARFLTNHEHTQFTCAQTDSFYSITKSICLSSATFLFFAALLLPTTKWPETQKFMGTPRVRGVTPNTTARRRACFSCVRYQSIPSNALLFQPIVLSSIGYLHLLSPFSFVSSFGYFLALWVSGRRREARTPNILQFHPKSIYAPMHQSMMLSEHTVEILGRNVSYTSNASRDKIRNVNPELESSFCSCEKARIYPVIADTDMKKMCALKYSRKKYVAHSLKSYLHFKLKTN